MKNFKEFLKDYEDGNFYATTASDKMFAYAAYCKGFIEGIDYEHKMLSEPKPTKLPRPETSIKTVWDAVKKIRRTEGKMETEDQKFARLFYENYIENKPLKEAYRAGYLQALKDVGNEFSKYGNNGRPCDECFYATEVLEAVKDFWEKNGEKELNEKFFMEETK